MPNGFGIGSVDYGKRGVVVRIHDHPYAPQMYVFPRGLAADPRPLLRLRGSLPWVALLLLLRLLPLRLRPGLLLLPRRLGSLGRVWLRVGLLLRLGRRHGPQVARPSLVVPLLQGPVLGVLTAGEVVRRLPLVRLRKFLPVTRLDRRPLALVGALE